MAMRDCEKLLTSKLKLLTVASKSAGKLFAEVDDEALNRHLTLFENKLREINELKLQVQEEKLLNEEAEDVVAQWGELIDEQVHEHELTLKAINLRLAKLEAENQKVIREKQIEQAIEEERRVLEMKLKIKADMEKREQKTTDVRVNLPKLSLTKFDGTPIDWFRFWEQFSCEIDRADIPSTTKFSYLKEFVNANVRRQIDGLPFNSEGYQRAKTILGNRYGQPSEIVNAHIQAIMELPTVHGSNPVRIQEFYETLNTHVQALQTMGKLKKVDEEYD